MNTRRLGFVVSMSNVVNLDIDIIGMDEDSRIKYIEYGYKMGDVYKTSKAYKCHLNDIRLYPHKKKDAYIFAKKHITFSNNWVYVEIEDVDLYGRALIKMYDLVTGKSFNKQMRKMKYGYRYKECKPRINAEEYFYEKIQ